MRKLAAKIILQVGQEVHCSVQDQVDALRLKRRVLIIKIIFLIYY
jgi:hypothetical protein